MNLSPDNWITNRRPDVFPALVERKDGRQEIWYIDYPITHQVRWQPWFNVPPPPKPKTQEELDGEMFIRLHGEQCRSVPHWEKIKFWKEACAYARQSERDRFVQLVTNLANDYHDVRNELIAIAKGATS